MLDETKHYTLDDSKSDHRSLEIECPNCHASIGVAVDARRTELVCKQCGSTINLNDKSKATWAAPSLSRIAHFEIISRLGVGAKGSVWKARDLNLDRVVAIKIPLRQNMTADEQERFFREAQAAAQLKHPNIVSVHEVGRDGESIYIVSDLIRGKTLREWFAGQRLTFYQAVELCRRIGLALHHAHEKGVVHRDLKPANIMIDADGEPHLMDFGLARRDLDDSQNNATMDGQPIGTPLYMSPEQAAGRGHAADRRSDVYSLGVILFELLTGELPFRGNLATLIHRVIHEEPPSPRTLNILIPKDLETITLKCLEKEPGRRYATALDVTDELARFLSGKPISARPVGPIESVIRWYQRNSAAVILTAGGYAILTSILLILWGLHGLLMGRIGVIQMSSRIELELALLTLVAYPTILVAGLATIYGRVAGIIGGLFVSYLGTIAMLLASLNLNLGVLQLEAMSAAKANPFLHQQICSLLLILSGIGAGLYTMAAYVRWKHAIGGSAKLPFSMPPQFHEGTDDHLHASTLAVERKLERD